MVETLPPPKSPFRPLEQAERQLDWHENHLRRRDGSRAELGLLAFLAAGTALLAALLWWWLAPDLATAGPPTSNRSE
jgi:hypothetical protein